MTPSLHQIAHALGGRVRRDKTGAHVVAPGPGQKPKDRSLSVWVNGDKIGLHSHRGDNWRELDTYVRDRCGLSPWRPTPRRRAPEAVRFSTRNMFFGETLAICRRRRSVTFEQFKLLMSDLRLRDGKDTDGRRYAQAFGFSDADLERTMQTTPRHYTADERAKIFNLTYAERQHLGLRRTGSIDVDKAGRERARRDRYNAKRRVTRLASRTVKALASIKVPSSQKVVGKNERVSGNGKEIAFSEVSERWTGKAVLKGRWEGRRVGFGRSFQKQLDPRAAAALQGPQPVSVATYQRLKKAISGVVSMSQGSKPDVFRTPSDERGQLRKIEADLIDQGIKPYPSAGTGSRARSLWRQIKPRLLRGIPVEITCSALGLDWHRQELKRARDDLVQMDLIKPRSDGRYIIGPLGPFSRLDELIRDQFFALKLLEQVAIGVCAISGKSKTRGRRRRS